MKRFVRTAGLALLTIIAPRLLSAQERGATVLGEWVAGLDVTPRVLVIGAHPDDEDTQLIAFLARGRQVQTGYLSLTRGDGGQNLIGNELGVQLGMIRTEELLAARRLDGGRQFFTRAFDFGFSKTAEETLRHWPRDSILRDVVTVVRAFRPQIIVAVFSGTPRDGHGHHQVSAMLAREAYDAAADTVRFPPSATLGLGAWSPSKFYRASRFAPAEATVTFNVGELSPFRGQSYAEIASDSRSQHLSQGFGILQRRGTSLDYLKLEQSRVSDVSAREATPFAQIPMDWSRFRDAVSAGNAPVRLLIDSAAAYVAAVRAVENLASPSAMVIPLARMVSLFTNARDALPCERSGLAANCRGTTGDLALTLETAQSRASKALLAASGVLVEATASREQLAGGDTMAVSIAVYNQGARDVTLDTISVRTFDGSDDRFAGPGVRVAPDSTVQMSVKLVGRAPSVPWWLASGKKGDVFVEPAAGSRLAINEAIGEDRVEATYARAWLTIAGVRVAADASPVVYRFADPARGEQRRPVAIVPAISAVFDADAEYARAGQHFSRTYNVHLHSGSASVRSVAVELSAPGLTVDTAVKHLAMEPFSDATATFHVSGELAVGSHVISARVSSGGETFTAGFTPITYGHIRPLRFYRPAEVRVEAVNANLPAKTSIAYIRGVGDNVAPMLSQLGLEVTMIAPDALASTDLSRFRTVVVGPRAFAASRSLVQQAPRLQAFARNGGTVVIQYGQQEIETPGILPYPVKLQRTAERVTEETAPVTVLSPSSTLLNHPNRIVPADFENWVQERSTYMPTTADPHYQHFLEMHDPGEAPNENALLVAPVGKGAYVYVTLALFRQLPAAVPGPARIFLNLLSADGAAPPNSLPRP